MAAETYLRIQAKDIVFIIFFLIMFIRLCSYNYGHMDGKFQGTLKSSISSILKHIFMNLTNFMRVA